MGKKLKLNLDDLKVSSFVTSIDGFRGGLEPTNTCGQTGGDCGTGGTGGTGGGTGDTGETTVGYSGGGNTLTTKTNTTNTGGIAPTGYCSQCC